MTKIGDALKLLFMNMDKPRQATDEEKRLIVTGYFIATKGKPAVLVHQVVEEYLSGAIDRPRYKRGKLPTSEEFGFRLQQLIAERKASGKVISEDATTLAPAYGPLWAVKLYSLLLAGADAQIRPPNRFYSMMIDKGGEEGERYRLDHLANNGYRLASLMLCDAEDAKGSLVLGSLQRFVPLLEAVPVDSQVFEGWKELHRSRGWPWIGSTGKMRVVYLPKGGVVGLAAIGEALKNG